MLKEAIDKAVVTAVLLIAGSVITACSDGDKDKAQALYNEATAAVEDGKYSKAIELLDSIDKAYPSQVDLRRTGMHLKAKAIEGYTVAELQTTDSLLAVATSDSEAMKEVVTFVSNPVEGYYVASTQKDVAVEANEGLHSRISPDGVFYVISSAKAGTLSTGVELSAHGVRAASAQIQPDGERNDRSRGSEIITFTQMECDTLGHFALDHVGEPLTLTFTGEKNRSITLPAAQAKALADMYAAANIFRRLRLLQLKKNKLEQQLTIARSQQARTYSDK